MLTGFFFLDKLANELKIRLSGAILSEIFTYRKSEMVFVFKQPDGQKMYLVAIFDILRGGIFVYQSLSRPYRNVATLFSYLNGQSIDDIFCFNHDRALTIKISGGYSFVLFFMGGRQNCILYKNAEAIGSFKKMPDFGAMRSIAFFGKLFDLSETKWFELGGLPERFFPPMGKRGLLYLNRLPQPITYLRMINFINWLTEASNFYVVRDNTGVHLDLMPIGEVLAQANNAIDATSVYARYVTQQTSAEQARAFTFRYLNEAKAKAIKYIDRKNERLVNLSNQRKPAEIANIIMANLHLVTFGRNELYDFYNDCKIVVEVPVNIRIVEYAERLYAKSKKADIELLTINENIIAAKQRIVSIELLLERLPFIEKRGEILNLIKGNRGNIETQTASLPYKVFYFLGYEIRVGKSDINNDDLLRYHSGKNDLWLHAVDAAGSHVVIREKQGNKFPKPVIEYAASLAAHYSKLRNASLAPIGYTLRKYVKKRKGFPAGMVTADRQEVVMVPPANPSSIDVPS